MVYPVEGSVVSSFSFLLEIIKWILSDVRSRTGEQQRPGFKQRNSTDFEWEISPSYTATVQYTRVCELG